MILRRAGSGIHAHADQAAGQKVACESRGSGARNLLRKGDDLWLISLLVDRNDDVGVTLYLNDAGVMQAVGISSPEISAVAPAGVVAIEIFSVVPRVTDAQPRHGITIAATTSSLIIGSFPPPTATLSQP